MKHIGIIGLGKMGSAIGYRLVNGGFTVFGYDLNKENCLAAEGDGIAITNTIQELALHTDAIWLMVPAGKIIDTLLKELIPLYKNKIIVDGGNSFFKDSIQRAAMLALHEIEFIDCGTSGGVHGKHNGFCLMIGGSVSAFKKLEHAFSVIATDKSYAYIGPCGSGHYIKMIHNGIEYALMQAYAQGLHIIHEGNFKEANLNLESITNLWNEGSVIRSWLLALTNNIFKEHGQTLDTISGAVNESGMGLWTIEEANAHNISASLIQEALSIRHESKKTGGDYSTKLVALMRNQFGGHAFERKEPHENS